MAVYTIDDVERIFKVRYTPEQRASLRDIPFSGNVLSVPTRTHMLFPGFPLSLLDVRNKHPDLFYQGAIWYEAEKHSFSRATVPVRWHLLRMKEVPGSCNKAWDEQCKLLLPDEEVPSVATVAFATVLHCKATGQQLFESCVVRTSDVAAGGNRVDFGSFGFQGLSVSGYWGGGRQPDIGLSSARKH